MIKDVPYPFKDKISDKKIYSPTNVLTDFEDKKRIVILAGQVQSGKTKYIIEIIKIAKTKFNYDHIFFISGTTEPLWCQSNNRLMKDEINFCDDINIDAPKKAVWSLLKNVAWLKSMKRIISDLKCLNKKVLIIDDESDYATPNNKKEEENPNETNKLIYEAYSEIKNGGLIFVSATPFANILNLKNAYTPDYIYTLPVNKDYTGLDFFNKLDNFYIYSNKIDSLDEIKKIKFSFCFFFLKAFLFLKKYPNEKCDLLIYVDDKQNTHKTYCNRIKELISDLEFSSKLKEYFKSIINEYNFSIDFDEFCSFIKSIKNNIEVPIKLNSEDKNAYEKYNNSNKKIKIIIGGVYLSRGFTYENLLTECFLYVSDNTAVDTMLQRCRWFGYRKSNKFCSVDRFKYMNVITTTDIVNKMKNAEKYNNLIIKDKECGTKELFSSFREELKKVHDTSKMKGTNNAKY